MNFDHVLPDINTCLKAIRTIDIIDREVAQVVVNGVLFLCEKEETGYAIIDANTHNLDPFYVYVDESKKLYLHGVGVCKGIADCKYHIWEIFDDWIKESEAKELLNKPYEG